MEGARCVGTFEGHISLEIPMEHAMEYEMELHINTCYITSRNGIDP